MPQPDDAAAPIVDWLDHLYGSFDGGWLTLFSVDRTTGERHTDWAPIDNRYALAAHAAHALKRAETCCVWFGVATRQQRLSEGKRGGASDCQALPGLWLDIDVAGPNHRTENTLPPDRAAAHQLLHAFPIPPTTIVDTGGGLQAHWLFNEPLIIDEATNRLLTRWGATWAAIADRFGWHLDNVFDLARIMRLPGTANRKGVPAPVFIVEAHWERRYGTDDLDQWLHDPPTPDPKVTASNIPYIGPQRPGDAFNARHRAPEMLEYAGWTYAHTDSDGNQHWTRPGKTVREGTSATVYNDDGHTTIWSDEVTGRWPTLQVRRPYDPFGLYVHLFHGGDWRAAGIDLSSKGYGDTKTEGPQMPGAPAPEGPQPVDWATFWTRERRLDDWAIPPVVPAGRLVTIWAKRKTGKSLFVLDIAAAAASGRSILGSMVIPPIDIIYLDMEMTEDDLEERLGDLGYGPDTDLSHFHYYLLPTLPPLDTEAGGSALMALVERHNPAVVVIDTMARVIQGEENSADTYRSFYRVTGMRLKQAGVACLRLDHAGKDKEKGERGSSAKGDDVDLSWELVEVGGGEYTLKRAYTRVSWAPESIKMVRQDEPLAHVASLGSGGWPAGTSGCANHLDDLEMSLEVTLTDAIAGLRKHDLTPRRRQVVAAAIRFRKTPRPVDNSENPVDNYAGTARDGSTVPKGEEPTGTDERFPWS